MPLLPKPYPDEVIGSVLERACLQSGMSMKGLAKSLFGSSRSSFSFLMATDLLQLAPLLGIDSEELLLKHTMFPYAVAYIPTKEQRRLKSKTLSRRTDECVGSITKSISHGVPFRRLCPMCRHDDLEKFGESYWRRAHLLPGVFVCPYHHITLHESASPLRDNVQLRTVLTPVDVVSAEGKVSVPTEILQTMQWRSLEALNSQIQSRDEWASHYKQLIQEKGYAVTGGDIAGRKMAQDLAAFFGESLLRDAGCYYPTQQRNPWPTLLVRECIPLNFATPKHLFFQTFCEVAPSSDGQFGYKKPGKVTRHLASDDVAAALRMAGVLQEIERTGTRITVKELLIRIGVWQSFRHNRDRYPLTNQRLQEFRASEQSERQLGLRPYWRIRLQSRYPKVNATQA